MKAFTETVRRGPIEKYNLGISEDGHHDCPLKTSMLLHNSEMTML